jgi:adenylate cyclase
MPHSPPVTDPLPLHRWLVDSGLVDMAMAELFDGFCTRLVALGVPLARGYLSFATLHPLQWAVGIVWEDGRVVDAVDIAHGYETAPAWQVSPFRHMLETRTWQLRRRLTGDDAVLDFPVLQEFRDAGLTDWFAQFQRFGWALAHNQVDELGVIFSWATARADGWSAADIAVIEELSPTLGLAVKAGSGHDTVRDLLSTYLGHDAAARVIAGQVRRGSVERRGAIILYADLRGFTDFADAAPPEEVVRRLNSCFDCMGEPVKAAGGEILKFLGDGLLAIFLPDAGRDMGIVAAAALQAAQEILAGIAQLNDAERAARNPPLALDIALHAGEVTYGNVGTADRLDFTVIGPAVNEVSRLEGLCKEVGRHLLISDAVVRAAPALAQRLCPLGHRRLRGVSEAREVYAGD